MKTEASSLGSKQLSSNDPDARLAFLAPDELTFEHLRIVGKFHATWDNGLAWYKYHYASNNVYALETYSDAFVIARLKGLL